MIKLLFGDFGQTSEAKVAFRKSLSRLAKETIALHDPFWSSFWLTFDSPSEATVLIPAEDIRDAIQARPHNIARLVEVISLHAINLANDATFPTTAPASVWSFSRSAASARDTTREMLNCIRVLTRLFPIIYESTNEHGSWYDEWLWRASSSSGNDGEQFVIDSDEEDATIQQKPVLGQTLMTTLLRLLFTVKFALPAEIVQDGQSSDKVQFLIWQPGVGSSLELKSDKSHEACRTELLRLLLALVSINVYSPNAANPFLDLLQTQTPRKIVLTLLCSLLNTALSKGQPTTLLDPADALSRLSTLALGSDPKQTDELAKSLPNICFQTLDIILVPRETADGLQSPPISPVRERGASLPPQEPVDTADNTFLLYCSKIHRKSDLQFLWDHFCILLQRPTGSSVSLLSSQTVHVGVTEAVVLLWRLTESNQSFLQFLMDEERSPTLLVLLLNICLDCKDHPPSFGLVRVCAYVLQTLSAQRGFCNHFNVRADRIPITKKYNVVQNGHINDFLITSVYTLIFTTNTNFSALYPAFTITIVNSAAYMKGLSVQASTKLVQLFLAFSAPTFLLADDGNPRLVYYLLEGFNNVISHQMSDNPNLIYAIIRSHRRFESLATFTLRGAVDEIRRARAERRAASPSASSLDLNADTLSRPSLKGNESTSSLFSLASFTGDDKIVDEEDPIRMSEKARGKMRERSMSFGERLGEEADPGHPGPYVSRTGFVPTEAWVSSWRSHLPLDTILLLLSELQPKVTSLCSVVSKSTNKAVVDYLSSVSLVGVLPAASPIKPRPFQHSTYSKRWLSASCWSLVYLTNPQIYAGTRITLFAVQQPAARDVVNEATQAISKVGSAVMERLPSASAVTSPRTPQRSNSMNV